MRVDTDGEVGIGMGTDAPCKTHVHFAKQDPMSGRVSSLKIGGYEILSSTLYNAVLQCSARARSA